MKAMELVFKNRTQQVKKLERLIDFNEFLIDQANKRIIYCLFEKRQKYHDDDAQVFFDSVIQDTRRELAQLSDDHTALLREFDEAVKQAEIIATKEA